jgi:hypothetical protein
LHDEDFLNILRCIAGIVFLGTPHKGSATQSKAAIIVSIASMFGQAEPTGLIKVVEKDSEMLNDLIHDFCFFEQRKSNLARMMKPIDRFLPQLKVRSLVPWV